MDLVDQLFDEVQVLKAERQKLRDALREVARARQGGRYHDVHPGYVLIAHPFTLCHMSEMVTVWRDSHYV